jgi:hypothetical protein
MGGRASFSSSLVCVGPKAVCSPSVLEATFSFIHLDLSLVLASLQLGQDFFRKARI